MEKIVSVVGLTSSGKSDLAIELAKSFSGEIVSADSRQVYTGLDWCSGKVTKQEQAQAVHHLLDVCPLGTQFSLFDFQTMAYEKIDDILKRKKLPILCGGTGLYTRSVVEGYNLKEQVGNPDLREKLEKLELDELLKMCKEQNIELPTEVTKRRVIRALEKTTATENPSNPKYNVLQLGIRWDREKIYERIKLRLERRMPFMIEEIKSLISKGESVEFLKSLGLEAKLVSEYLLGEFDSYEAFFEELFKQERHFAKRQNTWFNKEKNIIWLDGETDYLSEAKKLVAEFLG
ncbi:MAG: tRNA (adenosine(37)-N6)-dimethylallyltransferase MiaA [Clostridia bacterium]|nr:tRNA (adenosine(37)-N6)-dimethylallyltransferase MiaA [Clostridia bacterium]